MRAEAELKNPIAIRKKYPCFTDTLDDKPHCPNPDPILPPNGYNLVLSKDRIEMFAIDTRIRKPVKRKLQVHIPNE